MKRKGFVFGVILLVASFFRASSAAADFNPGKWQITTQTSMSGMPGMNMPAVTHVQCMKKGEQVPQSGETSKECKVRNMREDGDTVSWEIVCSGQNGAMEGAGRVTYSGDTMSGTMVMEIKGANMKMTSEVKGQRIGSCD